MLATERALRGPFAHRPRTLVDELVYAGVSFEILHDGDFAAQLHHECQRLARFGRPARPLGLAGHATCAVGLDPSLGSASQSRVVRWRSAPSGGLDLIAPGARARVRPVGAQRYAVSALVAPSRHSAETLLRAVAGALVHSAGGAFLHAVTAEVDGRAVLLLGPSGAGKSTAVAQLRQARCLAFDHAAVVPDGDGGWVVWGLPGGKPARAALSTAIALPLAGLLRVRRGAAAPKVVGLGAAEAVFALRESLESAAFSPDAEDASLDTVTALAAAVPVANAYTVLGASWDPELRAWLREARDGA